MRAPGSPPPRRTSASIWLAAGLCLAVIFTAPVRSPAENPALPALAAAGVTPEKIEQRLRRIDEASEIDAALKTKLRELCQKAQEQIQAALEWEAKGAAIAAARQRDPQELAELKVRLAQPAVEQPFEAPQDAQVTQLEQKLVDAEARLKKAQQELTLWETEPKRRRSEIPQQLAAAQQRQKEIDQELAGLPPTSESLDVPQARRIFLTALRAAVEQELAAYDGERLRYELNGELITAKQDLAAREVRQAESFVKRWRELLNQRRKDEADKQVAEARWAALSAYPELKALAAKNAELTEQQKGPDGLPAKIAVTTREVESLRKELAALKARFVRVRDKINAAGLTDAIGLLLQKQQVDLADLRMHRQRIRARQAEISAVQAKLIELEDQRADLADLDPHVRRVMATIDPALPVDQRHDIETALRELLQAKRGYLDSQIDDANTYFNALVIDLDVTERELVAETEAYRQFINERILWIRSAPAVGLADGRKAWDGLVRLAGGEQWTRLYQELRGDLRGSLAMYLAAGTLLVTLVALQRRLRRRISLVDRHTSQAYAAEIRPTFEVLVLTILIASTWPGLLAFFGWRLAVSPAASLFSQNMAFGLRTVAGLFLATELWRQICRKKGLAESHFGWSSEVLALVRRNLRWLMVLGLPPAFVVALVETSEIEPHRSSLGRLAFIAGMLLVAGFARRVLHPARGLLARLDRGAETSWLMRQTSAWHALAVAGPLLLASIAALGYVYTALALAWRLQATLWLVLGLLLARALLLRWLLVARRKLAIKQARDRRAAALAQSPHIGSGEVPAAASADSTVDLVTIDQQTRRLLRSLVAVGLLVGGWLIWVDVLPALEILDRWRLWPYLTEAAETVVATDGQAATRITRTEWITVGDLLLGGAVVLLTLIAGRNLPGLLEIAFLQRLPLDAGGRYAITTVCRYLITLAGLLMAFWMIGIGWSNVQWLAAAMTVGLGFGLQEIFANFVSGLIILFERPMRVGDTVTVGGVTGTVSRIRIRATTIIDWDRKELIVPNREFITGQLVNWTLTDSVLRIVMRVGVAYGSDVALTRQLLLNAAHDEPRVLREPAPAAIFQQFGDSTLDFELRVFVSGLDEYMSVRHDLNARIDRSFREAGIEIAFPQRDVHVRSVDSALSLIAPALEQRKRA